MSRCCNNCGKEYVPQGIINTNPNSTLSAYKYDSSKVCSLECKRQLRNKKFEETCLKKYGAKNFLASKSGRKVVQDTCIQKYGSRNPLVSKDIAKKKKETMLKRYGVEHNMQSSILRSKAEQKHLQKYGCRNPSQRKETREKFKQTCLDRYGTDHHWKNKDIREKCNLTYKKQTTFEVASQNPLVREKVYPNIKHDSIWQDELLFRKCLIDNQIKYSEDVATYFNVSHSSACRKLHQYKCYDLIDTSGSKQEQEVAEFISSVFSDFLVVVRNTRDVIAPYELDIYIPKLKLAFEYNGDYWHTEGLNKPLGYHDNKIELCRTKGITLIHVWESDWLDNQEEVKQRLQEIIRKKI